MSNRFELLKEASRSFEVSEYNERLAQKFLEDNPWLLKTELYSGLYTDFSREEIYTQITLPNLKRPDFVRREWTPSRGWIWEFIEIEPPGGCPLNKDNSYASHLNKALAQVYEWQQYASNNPAAMRELFPGFKPPLFGRIIVGRGELMSPTQRVQWQQVCKSHQYITVRTYTWLIEKLHKLGEDVIRRAVLDGPAKDRSALILERESMLALENRPYSTCRLNNQIRIEEIRGFVNRFRADAEKEELSRAEATAFENLVKNVFPNLGTDAREIREIIHDLDLKEPNVRIVDLMESLDAFIVLLLKEDRSEEKTAEETRRENKDRVSGDNQRA